MAERDQFSQLEVLSSTPMTYEEVRKTLGEFMTKNHVINGVSQDTMERLKGLHSELSAPPTIRAQPPTHSETSTEKKKLKKKKKHKKEERTLDFS